MVGVRAAQPHDLRDVPLRGAKGRLIVGAVLEVRVAIHLVEDGNQLVGGVEGGLRRHLDLFAEGCLRVPRGGRARTRLEGEDVRHGSGAPSGGDVADQRRIVDAPVADQLLLQSDHQGVVGFGLGLRFAPGDLVGAQLC